MTSRLQCNGAREYVHIDTVSSSITVCDDRLVERFVLRLASLPMHQHLSHYEKWLLNGKTTWDLNKVWMYSIIVQKNCDKSKIVEKGCNYDVSFIYTWNVLSFYLRVEMALKSFGCTKRLKSVKKKSTKKIYICGLYQVGFM